MQSQHQTVYMPELKTIRLLKSTEYDNEDIMKW